MSFVANMANGRFALLAATIDISFASEFMQLNIDAREFLVPADKQNSPRGNPRYIFRCWNEILGRNNIGETGKERKKITEFLELKPGYFGVHLIKGTTSPC